MALKKYFADGNSSWKASLDEFLCNVGGKFNFFCDCDTHKFQAYIPAFYRVSMQYMVGIEEFKCCFL